MKWKNILGWSLLICGVIGTIIVFVSPISYMFTFLGSVLALLEDPKTWILVPAGIALYYGWRLSRLDKTPGRYSLSKEETQEQVDISMDILQCIAERGRVSEYQSKTSVYFITAKTPHFAECRIYPGCIGSDECYRIHKVLDKLIDRRLRAIERNIKHLEHKK